MSYSGKRVKDVGGIRRGRETPTSLAGRAALLGRGPHGRDLGGLYELSVVPKKLVRNWDLNPTTTGTDFCQEPEILEEDPSVRCDHTPG